MSKKTQMQMSLQQAQKLVEFFGGENADVTISYERGRLRAWCTEYPEEGSASLGKFDPDAEPQP